MLSTIVINAFLLICGVFGAFLTIVLLLNRRLQEDVDESYLHDSLPPEWFLDRARKAGEASLKRRRTGIRQQIFLGVA